MKRILTYLRRLLNDVLFQRVCVVLITIPLASAVGFPVVMWRPSGWEWLLWAFLLGLTVFFASVLCAALFGTDATFKRASSYLEDGGHPAAIVLVLAVLILAIPITVLIRRFRPRTNAL